MRSNRRLGALVAAGALAALATATGGLSPTVAAAAGCAAMAVDYAFTSGQVVTLDPSHQTIAYGGCVQFTNNTASTVTITVAGGYSRSLGPGQSTTGAENYVGGSPGRHGVTASSGPVSAGGSITVEAAPRPSSPPSRSPASRPSAQSSSGGGSSPGTGPQVAPTASRSPAVRLPQRVGGTPTSRPARVAPAPTTPAPTISSSPAPVVVSGPIEPPSHRGTGLPAAVAALLVVGTAAGWVRVMLAEPVPATRSVDSRRTVGGPA